MGIAEKEEYDWKRGSFSWLVRSSSTHEGGRRIHERSRGRTKVVTGGSGGGMVECSQWQQSIRFGGLVAVIDHQQEWEKEEHKWETALCFLVCWVIKGKNKIVLRIS
ncbi:uncharacterized protein LOC111920352 [Lactuca sativa]|uniref:Uncharacterized protein n=1 Tax=Lactuca sativa TaxID=4236 RepID=A0A9R1XJ45_LACSA|nr:uncharacterized protein LOC111920352 [Lactuca sativa]KAJ0216610.1 hypothetical protein LSAT_V11C300125660 [Lactuca sativa]